MWTLWLAFGNCAAYFASKNMTCICVHWFKAQMKQLFLSARYNHTNAKSLLPENGCRKTPPLRFRLPSLVTCSHYLILLLIGSQNNIVYVPGVILSWTNVAGEENCHHCTETRSRKSGLNFCCLAFVRWGEMNEKVWVHRCALLITPQTSSLRQQSALMQHLLRFTITTAHTCLFVCFPGSLL